VIHKHGYCFVTQQVTYKHYGQLAAVKNTMIKPQFLTAACCPRRDFYTHTHTTKKLESDFCTEQDKLCRDARWPIYWPFLLKLANFRRHWPEEKVHGQKHIFGQFQTIVAKEIFIWPIGQFAANFRFNFIFCHVYFT
jgi:hypothetical protein